jgi:hypothetical protein
VMQSFDAERAQQGSAASAEDGAARATALGLLMVFQEILNRKLVTRMMNCLVECISSN